MSPPHLPHAPTDSFYCQSDNQLPSRESEALYEEVWGEGGGMKEVRSRIDAMVDKAAGKRSEREVWGRI